MRWSPLTARGKERAHSRRITRRTQPTTTTYNTLGYLFDSIVTHPVTVG
jgi:hypothetical protein